MVHPYRNGALALALLTGLLFWKYHSRLAGEDVAQKEPAESQTKVAPAKRVSWARGSRADEGSNVDTALTLRGVVLGTDGTAIAGATILIKDYEVAGNLPVTSSSARSDEEGRFEIPLREGAYYVHASKDGHGPAYLRAEAGDSVSLILSKSGMIDGHVRDEQGRPVTNFTIDVISGVNEARPALAAHFSKRFESSEGSFRVTEIPNFRVTIRASAPGYAPVFSESIVIAPGQTNSMDLTLSRGCTVEGMVTDKSGEPSPEVFLDAEARRGAGALSETSVDASSQAKSDEAGHFRLENVPKGRVLIRAYDGENAVTTAEIEVADCALVEPVNIVMSQGGSVAGVVRFDDGEPVAGALLTATHRTIGFVHAVSDAAGRFRFDQMPTGIIYVEVQHERKRASVRVRVKADDVVERDVTLPGEGKGVVMGRVIAGERALAGAKIRAWSYTGRDRGTATFHATTLADGSYRFTDMPKGAYVVQVMSTATAKPAVIQKGDEVITVDLDVAAVKPPQPPADTVGTE